MGQEQVCSVIRSTWRPQRFCLTDREFKWNLHKVLDRLRRATRRPHRSSFLDLELLERLWILFVAHFVVIRRGWRLDWWTRAIFRVQLAHRHKAIAVRVFLSQHLSLWVLGEAIEWVGGRRPVQCRLALDLWSENLPRRKRLGRVHPFWTFKHHLVLLRCYLALCCGLEAEPYDRG